MIRSVQQAPQLGISSWRRPRIWRRSTRLARPLTIEDQGETAIVTDAGVISTPPATGSTTADTYQICHRYSGGMRMQMRPSIRIGAAPPAASSRMTR